MKELEIRDGVVMEEKPLTALAYLQAIYRDPFEEPSIRRRVAMACLPFESPKFEAVAVSHYEGNLGDRLSNARKRVKELGAEVEGCKDGEVVTLPRLKRRF